MPVILHGNPTKRARRPLAASWRLAAGHYVAAKMTPEIIGPSAATEAETDNAWSRYRRCPSAIAYRVPVAVLGGAYPFYYELTTAPSGMAIGAQYGDTDYGIINWSNPTVGDHSIVVKVTDQDGTEVTRSWTLEVIDRENTTYFLFCDAANGSDSTGDGSYSDPYQTFLGWYGVTPGATTGSGDITFPGRQVFYRAGTYSTSDVTDPSGVKFWINPARKPSVHVAYPGEAVTFDCPYYWSGMTGDFCASGINWTGAGVDEGGLWRITYIRSDLDPDRNIIFENVFDGEVGTPDGGSNTSTIMLDNNTSRDVVISHNTFHEPATYILVYGVSYSVFQHNTLEPTGSTSEVNGAFLKSTGYDHWSIRANTGFGAIRPLTFQDGSTGNLTDIEICWNSYRMTTANPALNYHQTTGTAGVGPFWVYRNSFSGSGEIEQMLGGSSLTSPVCTYEKNILQGMTLGTDATFTHTDDGTGTTTNCSGFLNATTNLLEGDGLAYRGTHGAEVA